MKKNVMMRLASFLLVAVLISTSAISGTYAKYVTSEQGSDSARVAKWGVKVDVEGSTFANAYATDDKTLNADAQSRIGVNSVVSSGSVDVVAPGTKGDMAAIAISGKPEVAVDVSYVGVFDIEGWVDGDGNYYCPLIITVDENGYIDFTETGLAHATLIKERHDVLTKVFMMLGVSEENAAEDACKIEHVISDESFDAVKKHIRLYE